MRSICAGVTGGGSDACGTDCTCASAGGADWAALAAGSPVVSPHATSAHTIAKRGIVIL
jgi:hypothetical protein